MMLDAMLEQISPKPRLDIACIVLAAGLSRRFGSAKMCHPLASGEPLIQATINQYLQAFDQVHVVLADGDKEAATLLQPLPVQIVYCADNASGMSQSLIAGINATADADGWLIALGDMPYVRASTVGRLRAGLTRGNIVIPCYQGRTGNPVGFGNSFKNELLALVGDSGAKPVVRQATDKVISIETEDEGVLLDIDYPAAIL